ncbi:glycosyltransferase family 39 protein [Methanobacterium paludis]|uniref:Glycosyltransferase RgtA/B/C/D-like domain-containing protein n=1 Tax=Methanobacterium paludis (strain DSM 25820 / JCM 18151 / SWAN1) TaxID=868131 RepID=F6D739_METPW|nr:glycosyltransferase family 39 protein [Methanobacterium paludis]AEG18406.1 hypothetical protein MSWAN_1392 [Methanobacterium paludis]
MTFDYKQFKKFLWIIPAVVAFLIALIPTLKYGWPLTTDIFYQVHVAQVYGQYGLTLIDPLMDPGLGRKIGYPPLFSLMLLFLASTLKLNYFTVARALQPIFAFLTVLTVTYAGKKFYGEVAGISAGFLLISSFLFSRLMSPLPETLALIFVTLAVYLFYRSAVDKKYLYAVISGFLFILVVLTHQSAPVCLFAILTACTLVVGILKRDTSFFKSYAVFLATNIVGALIVALALFLIAPNIMHAVLAKGVLAATGYHTSLPTNDPISNLKYIAYLGILLLFVVIGGFVSYKKRRTADIFIITWAVVMLIASKAYWFGVNVTSIRLLVYLLLPLSILGGSGLSYLYNEYKKKEFTSKSIRSAFLISVFVISSLYGITTVQDPNFNVIPKYDVYAYQNMSIMNPQIAPPTTSDVGLADWFSKNANSSYGVVSNNQNTNQFLVSTTGQTVFNHYTIGKMPNNASLIKYNIRYLVFDKRLTFSGDKSQNKTLTRGMYTFVNNATYGTDKWVLPYMKLVYENTDYNVYEITINS